MNNVPMRLMSGRETSSDDAQHTIIGYALHAIMDSILLRTRDSFADNALSFSLLVFSFKIVLVLKSLFFYSLFFTLVLGLGSKNLGSKSLGS